MTKNYREYIGRLAQNGETGRGSIFINRLGIIQFHQKMVDYLKKALIYGHTSRISS